MNKIFLAFRNRSKIWYKIYQGQVFIMFLGMKISENRRGDFRMFCKRFKLTFLRNCAYEFPIFNGLFGSKEKKNLNEKNTESRNIF